MRTRLPWEQTNSHTALVLGVKTAQTTSLTSGFPGTLWTPAQKLRGKHDAPAQNPHARFAAGSSAAQEPFTERFLSESSYKLSDRSSICSYSNLNCKGGAGTQTRRRRRWRSCAFFTYFPYFVVLPPLRDLLSGDCWGECSGNVKATPWDTERSREHKVPGTMDRTEPFLLSRVIFDSRQYSIFILLFPNWGDERGCTVLTKHQTF